LAIFDDIPQAPASEGDSGGSGFKRNRTDGHIIRCDGERAVIVAKAGRNSEASEDYWAVGQMISVVVGSSRIVGLIYEIEAADKHWDKDGDNWIQIHIELVGEITQNDKGKLGFNSGIAQYPYMGAIAHRIRGADLAAVYESTDPTTVTIGNLSQDTSIPALITIDKLLSRHFAVVGTTGVGKSTSVTLLIRKIIEQRPDIRVLMLDPHNEFVSAFPDKAVTVDASNLELPFWMFRLDELTEVIFRGRPGMAQETDALRDLIPLAKERYKRSTGSNVAPTLLKRETRNQSGLTADTPVPYRMTDLMELIEERVGQLDGKSERPHMKALKNRLESILSDPRFQFMFGGKTVGDSLLPILSHIFRMPQNGKPICVFEMSGLPSEVVNAVVSVMCRMAFDLGISSEGTIQTLVVCEEAHRYIPSDPDAGFWPTRAAIARIAKEGRKYGVFLGVITQRPGELDTTILSQCNTIFAMRLGNERDQEIIKQAITGAAKSTTSFLSSIANREAIAFGEAIHTPMRMMFEFMPRQSLPGSHLYDNQEKLRGNAEGNSILRAIARMRGEPGEDLLFETEMEPEPQERAQVNNAPPLAGDSRFGNLAKGAGEKPPHVPVHAKSIDELERSVQAHPIHVTPHDALRAKPETRSSGNSLISSFRNRR
jgi:DNA helicase HerA-like ATPase